MLTWCMITWVSIMDPIVYKSWNCWVESDFYDNPFDLLTLWYHRQKQWSCHHSFLKCLEEWLKLISFSLNIHFRSSFKKLQDVNFHRICCKDFAQHRLYWCDPGLWNDKFQQSWEAGRQCWQQLFKLRWNSDIDVTCVLSWSFSCFLGPLDTKEMTTLVFFQTFLLFQYR